jgi:kynurenine formamidase
MRIRTLTGAGLAMLLLGWTSMALAHTDGKPPGPPSPWGPNDQTGATNCVTPAVTKAAAAAIQEGKVILMSYPLVDGVPLFGTRFSKTILTAVSLAPSAALGENELTYMEDTWLSQSHVGTHLDGLGHIERRDWYFNQTPMEKDINQNTMTRCGLENVQSFATRGVLVNAVQGFQQAGKLKGNANCRKPWLDKSTVIARADLEAGLKMSNATLREGDIVIIHTGWGDLFEPFPAKNAEYNSGEPACPSRLFARIPPASPLAVRSRPAARVQPQAGARRHPSHEPTARRRAQLPCGGSRAHSRRGVSAGREQWGRWDAGNNAVCFSEPLHGGGDKGTDERKGRCTTSHTHWIEATEEAVAASLLRLF